MICYKIEQLRICKYHKRAITSQLTFHHNNMNFNKFILRLYDIKNRVPKKNKYVLKQVN